MRQRIGILSLGCPRNLVDSENIAGLLRRKGHSIVALERADTALINTCAFIEEAKQESIDAILDLAALKKEGRLKRIIVHGCLSQRYKDLLRRKLPEVDAFVGRLSLNHSAARFPLTPRHYAYLKICEGCLNRCTYCAIPSIKGGFTSLDEDSLLRRADAFNKARLSELILVGQDITGYGKDLKGKTLLASLVRNIVKRTPRVGWLRLLYLYPSRVSDDLLRVIRDEPKVCQYIDLPIQHINDRILRWMGRGTKKSDLLKLMGKIRRFLPQAFLRTSVIVGFPSETDKEFKELLCFLQEARFERLGAFLYSREEGTPAYSMSGQVSRKIKEERFDALMALQQNISREINAKFLGSSLEVLIDEKQGAGYLGRTRFDAPEVDGTVYVKSVKKLKPGDFIKVKITDTMEYDLVGEVER